MTLPKTTDIPFQFPSSDEWLVNYLAAVQQRSLDDIRAAVQVVMEALDDIRCLHTSAHAANVPPAWCDALRILQKKLESRLFDLGLTPIETVGSPLDPTRHHVSETTIADLPAETIVSEILPGYLFHGQVFRPAIVVTVAPQPVPDASRRLPNTINQR
jgi:molecular chaperone GrpE (heat shock protein)